MTVFRRAIDKITFGSERPVRRLVAAYVLLAAVFFAMFYPYASGVLTPTAWLDWLKWFPKIYY